MKIRGQIADIGSIGTGVSFSADGDELHTEYSYIAISVPIPLENVPEHLDLKPMKEYIFTLTEVEDAG